MKKITACGISLLIATALILSAVSVMATTIPHERYGQVLIDGSTAPDGYSVSSWIYGTEYEMEPTFNGDGSYQLYTPGDDPVNTVYKTGGFDGETVVYRVDDGAGNVYIADEISTFESGEIESGDLNFQTSGQPDNDVKINEIVVLPDGGGNQYVYIFDEVGITLSDWRLDTTGFSGALDTLGTEYHPIHTELLYVDLGDTGIMDSDGGYLTLSWNAQGGIAGNNWVVMDRVEYGNIVSPVNTIHPEFPTSPGAGQGLVRDPWGHDTDSSVDDFILADETGRPVMPDVELTISSTDGGEVTTPGEGKFTYEHGEDVDLVAVADAGYEFVEWTGDVGTIDDTSGAETTITMNGDYSITAEFQILTHTLTVNTEGQGSVDLDPDQAEYDHGTSVTLMAIPATDWVFVEWTGDVTDTEDEITIIMDDDHSVTAVFEEYVETYTLTINVDGDGATDPAEGTHTYDEGASVTITATPSTGWEFARWEGDATGTSLSITVTMDSDKTVTAVFETDVETYTLTIASTSGGTVTTPGEGTFSRIEGTVVNLVAVADVDYEFVGWTGDTDTIDDTGSATTTITMDDDYSITAEFQEIPPEMYTLTVNIVGDGSVERSPHQAEYEEGTTVTLTAVPEDGWEFDGWSGDVTDTDLVVTITMDSDKTVTANFETEDETFELTIDSTSGGQVTDPGEETFRYREGREVDLVAEADDGYEFVEWTGHTDTIDDTSAAETTITMNGDYSITAEFREVLVDTYTLTVNIEGDGTTDPAEGTHTYDDGEEVTITATAASGWEFVEWTGDATGTDYTVTVTMDSHKTVTAVFHEEGVPVDTYTLTVDIEGQGTTSPAEGTHTYDDGEEVTVTATAASGWKFVEWTGDASGTSATITVTMDQDKSITAVFQAEDDEPSEPGFLEDYWWLLLLLIIVIIVVILLATRRGKDEPVDDVDDFQEDDFDDFEEESMEEDSEEWDMEEEEPEEF